MKAKYNIYFIIILAIFIFYFSVCFAKNNSHEEFVHKFYIWYGDNLLKNIDNGPLFNDKIYEYVNRCTIDRLRVDYKRKFIGYDYFTKGNDFWKGLLETIIVEKEIYIDNNISIVPVVFSGDKKHKHIVLVFLKKGKDSLSIIKVEDT